MESQVHPSFLDEFRLDLHIALDVALERSPTILCRSTLRTSCQLCQVLIEPVSLHLLEFVFPLLRTRPALHALEAFAL